MSADQSWTLGRLIEWTTQFLSDKGSESPRLDAEVLLAHALGSPRIQLYTRWEEIAADATRQKFRELVRRRVEGCPVAYLVGKKEFFSLALEVGPAVLIPRPDSETVVVECLRQIKEEQIADPAILDLGVGSGNLAIAIAHQCKAARVTAVDASGDALALARRNADKHAVAERITFLEGDLFAPLPPEARFHVVVTNPPYIPTAEITKLAPGVRDYEPHRALDGGPDGFAVFDRIIAGVAKVLMAGGWLILEIGSDQEKPAREKITAHGGYELGKTVYDSAGHPRVLKARLRLTTQ